MTSKIDGEKDRVLWARQEGGREITRELALSWSDLVLGADDEHILLAQGSEIHLLDGTAGERRTLALPGPIAIDGASAIGIPSFDRSRMLMNGVLVICRTPSLLVVALEDIRAALRKDAVVWSLRTTLPLADRSAWEPARTPSTGRGIALGRYMTTSPLRDGVAVTHVRSRIWLPFGYERIDCADGTSVPWHAPPPPHEACETPVGQSKLWVVRVDPNASSAAWGSAAPLAKGWRESKRRSPSPARRRLPRIWPSQQRSGSRPTPVPRSARACAIWATTGGSATAGCA